MSRAIQDGSVQQHHMRNGSFVEVRSHLEVGDIRVRRFHAMYASISHAHLSLQHHHRSHAQSTSSHSCLCDCTMMSSNGVLPRAVSYELMPEALQQTYTFTPITPQFYASKCVTTSANT